MTYLHLVSKLRLSGVLPPFHIWCAQGQLYVNVFWFFNYAVNNLGCIVLIDWMIVLIGSDVAFLILCEVIILAFAWRG